MNGSREMTDRNQHSLPEFYRRFFTASDQDHLYRYVAGGQQPQREGVEPGASLTHTYGFTASAGALTLPTIEARLSELERGTARRVRETVLEERPLNEEFKEKISIFLLSQERRTPKHRAARDNWSRQLAETRHDEGLLRQIAEQNIRRSSPMQTVTTSPAESRPFSPDWPASEAPFSRQPPRCPTFSSPTWI